MSRRTGPTLSPETTEAIEQAVFDGLASRGYGRLTIEEVARRAGVGKAAVYRRWPSKLEMVLGLLTRAGLQAARWPDTGTLAGDVDQALTDGARQLRQPRTAAIVADLIGEAARDSELAAEITRRFGAERRRRGRAVIDRAVARGELSPDVDRELALDLLPGPIVWRLVATRRPLDEAELARLARATLAGLRAL